MISENAKVIPRDLEVDSEGLCNEMDLNSCQYLKHFPWQENYRFKNLVDDINTLLDLTDDDLERIRIATVLTRRFLDNTPQLADLCPPPDPEIRVSTECLYRESNSKFRINIFSWLPQHSNVHCHGSWSIVAFLGDATTGRELNYFWRREDDGSIPEKAVVKPISKKMLEAGDIIGFTSDAIHNIKSLPSQKIKENQSNKPTLMFNIFGEDNPDSQLLFNPFDHTYKYY